MKKEMLTAQELMKLEATEEVFMLEESSLCTVCSWTVSDVER